jgi:O-antigen/teichoic acid export membrane protein
MIESNNRRIAKNTLYLYFRMLLTMGVSLYTSRVVLNTLGIQDYGIYNVVGGVIGFFAFLSSSMTGASQRFFSFALGKGDKEQLENTFATTLIIYIFIIIIATVLLETLGLWFLYEKLKIPTERVFAARWTYQFSVIAFVVSILRIPFNSLIVAHEDMKIYAYVSIADAVAKLGMVFVLVFVSWDKLILYSILMCLIIIIFTVVYIVICRKKYEETKFRRYFDKRMFNEMFAFTGWSLFGSITVVLKNQAVTILLNQFFNPVIVAARAIADQINAQAGSFAGNFNTSLYPPIIKSYAAGEIKQMFRLIFKGSKITYFLMFVFTLPLVLEMPVVLKIWLKNPPEWAALFSQLTMITLLIDSVSFPLMTTARATGKVKLYELTLGSIFIVSFLVSWMVLYLGMPAYSVILVAIGTNIVMFFARLLMIRYLTHLSVKTYFKQVVFPMTMVTLCATAFSYLVKYLLPEGYIYSFIVIVVSVILVAISMYFIGLNKLERTKVQSIIINKSHKYFRCF